MEWLHDEATLPTYMEMSSSCSLLSVLPCKTPHKTVVEAAVRLNRLLLGLAEFNHQFDRIFFPPKKPKDIALQLFSQEWSQHKCVLSPSNQLTLDRHTELTNIDSVLPVFQHFCDDEYVNICPVLPVPILEGKGTRMMTKL